MRFRGSACGTRPERHREPLQCETSLTFWSRRGFHGTAFSALPSRWRDPISNDLRSTSYNPACWYGVSILTAHVLPGLKNKLIKVASLNDTLSLLHVLEAAGGASLNSESTGTNLSVVGNFTRHVQPPPGQKCLVWHLKTWIWKDGIPHAS